jgi:sortase (surface protein transpeptidase)
VWRVPDFGTAYERKLPMILAAHRFGYIAWTNQYRRQNSFFNLPELVPGDKVEVIWNQRRYVYEIYAGEEGKEITQYTADLILYTCKLLESDIRIFRYAKLIEQNYFDISTPVATISGKLAK